jgi:alpha-beta hydrolase superfamily lysophospholipase
MPNSEVVMMPGIGHLPMLEAPRENAQAYRAFLHRVDAAASDAGSAAPERASVSGVPAPC